LLHGFSFLSLFRIPLAFSRSGFGFGEAEPSI